MVSFAALHDRAERIALLKMVRRRAHYLSLDRLDRLLAGKRGRVLGSLTVGELLDQDPEALPAYCIPHQTPTVAELLPEVEKYVRTLGGVLRSSEVARRFHIPRWTAATVLGKLTTAGVLERTGRTGGTRYTVREPAP